MGNFEKFYDLKQGASSEEWIGQHSLTVVGWATACVADYEEIKRSRASKQSHTLVGGCMGFGDSLNPLVAKFPESFSSVSSS